MERRPLRESRGRTCTSSPRRATRASESTAGERRATTPVDVPLLLPTGPHTIRFVRSGYASVTRTGRVRSEGMEQLACAMVADPASGNRGALRISTNESFASVTVDGEPFRSDPLPPGPHAVRVERSGFLTFSRIIHVEPSREQTLKVVLQPTPATIRERDAGVRRQRTWALGVGIGGLALAGGAIATYAVNAGRYDAWQSERDQYRRELAGGTPTPEQRAQASDLAHQAADIQRVDDLALGMGIAAGGALITAGALWLTSL